MSQVQSGILPEHCRAAIWIEANVKGDVNALRAGSKVFAEKLAAFQDQFPDAHLGAVVAFGHNTWRELSGGVGAQELKDFLPCRGHKDDANLPVWTKFLPHRESVPQPAGQDRCAGPLTRHQGCWCKDQRQALRW